MTVPVRKQSRIDTLYVWERLEEIVTKKSSTPFVKTKRLKEFIDELAHNIKVDTGLAPDEILMAEDDLSEALQTLNLVVAEYENA